MFLYFSKVLLKNVYLDSPPFGLGWTDGISHSTVTVASTLSSSLAPLCNREFLSV